MTHTLKLTNGGRSLAASLLTLPDQFKTPSEVVRAGNLFEILKVIAPSVAKLSEEEARSLNAAWADTPAPVEVTEAQRDLLKAGAAKNADKIPLSVFAVSLLTELGFTE